MTDQDHIQKQAMRLMSFAAELAAERTNERDSLAARVAQLEKERESFILGIRHRDGHIAALTEIRNHLQDQCARLRQVAAMPAKHGEYRTEVVIGQQALIVDADNNDDCTTVYAVYALNGTELTEMFFDRDLRERIEDMAGAAIDAELAAEAE